MFHVKQFNREELRKKYLSLVKQWDKTHRLVGRGNPGALLGESEEAVSPLLRSHPDFAMVDVGAGSGILGMAWALAGKKVHFVEVDPKKAAFLLLLSSEMAGLEISTSACALENVSRETLISLGRYFTAARAFSGQRKLVESIMLSPLADSELFEFSVEEINQKKKFFLKCLKSSKTQLT
jgi:16S rRNA G527 N7-methylase RsmG